MSLVTWVLPSIERARELHRFLHFNHPGGNQDMHDELASAILRAEKVEDGHPENRADLYLQQMRNVWEELETSRDEEDGFEGIHLAHLADTWRELEHAIAAGDLPTEWQQRATQQ